MVDIFKIQRGGSKTFPFVVLQDDNITPEDLGLFTNILVQFIHLETGAIMESYAMAALTEGSPSITYNTADFHIVSAVAGTFEIALQSAKTLNAELGEYIVVVEPRKTDSDFTEGYEKDHPFEKLFEIIDKHSA